MFLKDPLPFCLKNKDYLMLFYSPFYKKKKNEDARKSLIPFYSKNKDILLLNYHTFSQKLEHSIMLLHPFIK